MYSKATDGRDEEKSQTGLKQMPSTLPSRFSLPLSGRQLDFTRSRHVLDVGDEKDDMP